MITPSPTGWNATRTVELPIPTGKARVTVLAANANLEAASDEGPARLVVTIVATGRSESEAQARAMAAGADAGHADAGSVTFTVGPASGSGDASERSTAVLFNPPHDADVTLATTRGSIHWKILRHGGAVRLSCGEGDVAVTRHEGGPVTARSALGNVTIHSVASTVDASACRGNAVVRTHANASAASLRVFSTWGDATLDVTRGWADAGTVVVEDLLATRPAARMGPGAGLAFVSALGGAARLERRNTPISAA